MDLKYNMFLAAKFSLVMVAIFTNHIGIAGTRLQVRGHVSFDEDATPVAGGEVLLLEGKKPTSDGELPSFIPFARAITDADGDFAIDISRKPAVMIELVRDKCDWHGARRPMSQIELSANSPIAINMTTTRDNTCGH